MKKESNNIASISLTTNNLNNMQNNVTYNIHLNINLKVKFIIISYSTALS